MLNHNDEEKTVRATVTIHFHLTKEDMIGGVWPEAPGELISLALYHIEPPLLEHYATKRYTIDNITVDDE